MSQLRIVSLIPSATEIVDCLGLTDYLIARSHECDYPPQVDDLPICTGPKFDPEGSSGEIHDRVTQLLQSALSVYHVKTDLLEQLQPTHILTQAQCEVCAVSLSDVEDAVATLTHRHPQVISLQPKTLEDVWQDIRRVAIALGISGEMAVRDLRDRVYPIQQKTQSLPERDRPRVACIEWTDPLMAAGNWIPQLVEIAGGTPLFAESGQHSPWLDWEALVEADPDLLIFMPCGYDIARTRQEIRPLQQKPEWPSLKAVQTGKVYLVDGNQYFNRPGPRLVDSLEILAELIQPSLFRFGYRNFGWQSGDR